MGTEQERQSDEAIDEETATALPKREAMSMIAPPPVAGMLKSQEPGLPPPINSPSDGDSTGQGIDESDPGTGA